MCYHLSKVFLGIPGCQMWPRNRLEPPVFTSEMSPDEPHCFPGPLDAPNGSYACPVPPSRVDLLVLSANVTPNVSSNVAGKSANEPWSFIVGNIIYKWWMSNCQVWLYRGSIKHMGFRLPSEKPGSGKPTSWTYATKIGDWKISQMPHPAENCFIWNWNICCSTTLNKKWHVTLW